MALATRSNAYAAYLNSPEWKAKRLEALRRAGFRCQACPETENLEVHHLTYDSLGFERPQDLRVLCNPCHAAEHGRGAKNDRVVSLDEAFWRAHGRTERDDLEDEQERVLEAVLDELRGANEDPACS